MDINGGFSPNPNGSPIWPGTVVTGPLIAGNVIHSDGTGALANLGENNTGLANQGYCVMAQSSVVNQATNVGVAGKWVDPNLVIPAQSQILHITLMVTSIWTGAAATLGIGTTASATAFTAAAAVNGGTLGQVVVSPGTSLSQIANWDNVGSSDVQIALQASNTGTGVGTLTVEYLQGINMAS